MPRPAARGLERLGLAVQAYQKRAPAVLRYLGGLARETRRTLNVRLVKGAYWDSEIKRAQERGLPGYPVFTRKANTDVSYLACARLMLERDPRSIRSSPRTTRTRSRPSGSWRGSSPRVRVPAPARHGRGAVRGGNARGRPRRACRVYAPVGEHEDLLPYLVRRLLENGANTSFVNRIVNESEPVEDIVADPVRTVDALARGRAPEDPAAAPTSTGPSGAIERPAARGRRRAARAGRSHGSASRRRPWLARRRRRWPTSIDGPARADSQSREHAPRWSAASRRLRAQVDAAVASAAAAQPDGNRRRRAPAPLRSAGRRPVRGRTRTSSSHVHARGRQDAPRQHRRGARGGRFLRYYAAQARARLRRAAAPPGPTGESNELSLRGRGVFACISPWNFPLAIFTGQVAAALAAGNAVVAKPAEQTPLVAARRSAAARGRGARRTCCTSCRATARGGRATLSDPRVAGVAFTGSTETARPIIHRGAGGPRGRHRPADRRDGRPERDDRRQLRAARAGRDRRGAVGLQQRGPALLGAAGAVRAGGHRDRVLRLLAGCMDELVVGDPRDARHRRRAGRSTAERATMLERACARPSCRARAGSIAAELGPAPRGTFVAPLAVRSTRSAELEREVFGPILHVLRYRGARISSDWWTPSTPPATA